jgi:hypothetical protein
MDRVGLLLRALVRGEASVPERVLPSPAVSAVRAIARDGTHPQAPPVHVAPDEGAMAGAADTGTSDAGATATAATGRTSAANANAATALALSGTARLLLGILRDMPRSVGSGMASLRAAGDGDAPGAALGYAEGVGPLFTVGPAEDVSSSALAMRLRDAVERSGAFYEAHLAQWREGTRNVASLALEPQARWSTTDATREQGAAAVPPPHALPILRQQLEILDSGRFVWSGAAWPGQPLSLAIEEDVGHRAEAAPMRQAWRVRVALDLPRLGRLRADIVLHAAGLRLTVDCADASAARRLEASEPALRSAMQKRDLAVEALTIAHEADT